MRQVRALFTILVVAGAVSLHAQTPPTMITGGGGGTVTTVPSGAAGISINNQSSSAPDVAVTLGNGGTAMGFFKINGSNNPGLMLLNGTVIKFSLGIPTATSAFIDGANINDVTFRADGGGAMLFSTDTVGHSNDLTLKQGKVGIGIANPTEILTVQKAAAPTFLGLSGASGSHTSIVLGRTAGEARLGIAAAANNYALDSVPGDAILRVDDSTKSLRLLAGNGNSALIIGGTSITAAAPFQVQAATSPLYPARFLSNTGGTGVTLDMSGSGEIDVSGLKMGGTAVPVIQATGTSQPVYLNPYVTNGDVIIGSTSNNTTNALKVQGTGTSTFAGNVSVTGTLTASAVINAVYQDVAEWVPADRELVAGTVVVLDPSSDNQVRSSSKAYDTAVAGVVSAQPGVVLGIAAPGKEKIATTGRVKVRVDATNAPIGIGDLLVTSDVEGTAMKSQPLDVAGVKLHRPGTVIGKALQSLASGRGEILVLLSLQ